MSSIMELIGPEMLELSALESENVPYLGQIEPEHPELFALEFGKLLNLTSFALYHLQILTNQHQT